MGDLREECGVGAVFIFNNSQKSAVALAVEICQDQRNRGELSSGLASLNVPDSGHGPIFNRFVGLGDMYAAFGRPDKQQHSENLALFDGNPVQVHNRYDTSSRRKNLEQRLESESEKSRVINLEIQQVLRNAQPMTRDHNRRFKANSISYNGNLVNAGELRQILSDPKENYNFKTNTDTEVIQVLLALELKKYEKPLVTEDFVRVFSNLAEKINGAYTLVYMDGNGNIIFARDPNGFKPAVFGIKKDEQDDFFAAASETSALDKIGISDISELEPGKLIHIDKNGVKGPFVFSKSERKSHCIFEPIYFAKAESRVFGIEVQLARNILGATMAELEDTAFEPLTFYSSIPSTPIPMVDGYIREMRAIGFDRFMKYINENEEKTLKEAKKDLGKMLLGSSLLQFDLLIKYGDVRTFLAKDIKTIEGLIEQKHLVSRIIGLVPESKAILEFCGYSEEDIKRRPVVLFDDSIVRGNTIRKNMMRILKNPNVREAHLRIGSAKIECPCYFGIDIPTREELIGAYKSEQEVLAYINDFCDGKVKSLRYLPVDKMVGAVVMAGKLSGANLRSEDFCTACFTGKYPLKEAETRFRREYS